MATTMTIEVSRAVGPVPVTIFHIEGDIDVSSYEEFQAQGEQAYKDGTRNLLLDLTNVKYIGSAGMRAIHAIFMLLQSDETADVSAGIRDGTFKSPHLKLLNPSRDVANALKIAGFDMFLESFTNRQQAIDSFA